MTDVEFAPPPGQGYDLQKVHAEKRPAFWFKWADRWWMLPNLHLLDFEIQLRVGEFQKEVATVENITELGGYINTLFNEILNAGKPGQGADWQNVTRPLSVLMDLMTQWVDHSGGDKGESEASTSSSKSTGRPSKRTSKPSTASASPKRSTARTRKADTPPANS